MTERVLYLEPVGGIAGDMFLAAALDLGVPLEDLEAALKSLGLEGWHFEVTRATRHGIVGTHVDVVVDSEASAHSHHGAPHTHSEHTDVGHSHADAPHAHSKLADACHSHGDAPHTHTEGAEEHHSHGDASHTHAEEHHSHGDAPHTHTEGAEEHHSRGDAPHTHAEGAEEHHSHGEAPHTHTDPGPAEEEHTHGAHHGAPGSLVASSDEGPTHAAHSHRSWRDIDALIRGSRLPERAKLNALKVFRILGEAEAKVHGVGLEEIHFHEVGAVDSIVDICGAAVALELLGNPRVLAAPPPLGSGTTRISHGVVPVPVPATLEVLRGVPVRFEGRGELTTPTGAALLKAFATVGPPPELVVERIGYGVGTKDFPDRANVLRASLATTSSEGSSTLVVLECNLDDCSPQVLGVLVEMLMARGALDAWIAPVVMKKGRPGHLIGVLATHDTKEALESTLLEETTTLGVRQTQVTRTALERRWETVTTRWGPVRVKLGLRGTHVLNAAPEFEDCRALAQKAGVPVKDVQAAAVAAYRKPVST